MDVPTIRTEDLQRLWGLASSGLICCADGVIDPDFYSLPGGSDVVLLPSAWLFEFSDSYVRKESKVADESAPGAGVSNVRAALVALLAGYLLIALGGSRS